MTVKLSHHSLASLTLSVLFSASAWTACSPSSASEKPVDPPAPPVKLVAPRTVLATSREEVTGTLYPDKALQLGFEVSGRIEKVKVKKGDRVSQGQVLAQLDPEIADAQVKQAEAALAAAEAGWTMASDVAQRNERLLAKGSISDLQSKNASSTSRQAQAQVLAARAALAQARAARKRHDLRAPFAGTVINAPEQVGAMVNSNSTLFTIEQLDTLVLKATIPETTRDSLKVGAKVKVAAVTGSVSTEDAVVRTILPSADPSSRRIPVEVSVPNSDGRFVAHTLVRAVLPLGEPQPAQSIPATALSSAGGDHVFVLNSSGETQRIPVEVVERGSREVVVKAPSPLEKVVDYPSANLGEGIRVSVNQ